MFSVLRRRLGGSGRRRRDLYTLTDDDLGAKRRRKYTDEKGEHGQGEPDAVVV